MLPVRFGTRRRSRPWRTFYWEIYAVDGVTDVKFPEHYPVSRLLGCVEVVGCVSREELSSWEAVPEGVNLTRRHVLQMRLEAQTDFCWLCEQPQRLVIPFETRGLQGVYNLEKKIFDAAVRGLSAVEGPLPVRLPIPDPRDPFSLKPVSSSLYPAESKALDMQNSSGPSEAIAGAQAAATRFLKKNQGHPHSHPTTAAATKTHLSEYSSPPTDIKESPTAIPGQSSHSGTGDNNKKKSGGQDNKLTEPPRFSPRPLKGWSSHDIFGEAILV